MNKTYKTTPEQREILVRLAKSGMSCPRVAAYARTFFGVEYSSKAAYNLLAVRGIKIRHGSAYDPEYVAYVIETAKTHRPANLYRLIGMLSPDRRGQVPTFKSVSLWLERAGVSLERRKTYTKREARDIALSLARSGATSPEIQHAIRQQLGQGVNRNTVDTWCREAGIPRVKRWSRIKKPSDLPCQDNMLIRDWEAAEARSIRAAGNARWWESDEAGLPIRRRRAA